MQYFKVYILVLEKAFPTMLVYDFIGWLLVDNQGQTEFLTRRNEGKGNNKWVTVRKEVWRIKHSNYN